MRRSQRVNATGGKRDDAGAREAGGNATGQLDVDGVQQIEDEAVPNFTPARKNTVGASGNAARPAGSVRSHAKDSIPRELKAARSRRVLKRETAMTRSLRPSSLSVRRSMIARWRPILPPAPSTRNGPGVRSSTALTRGVGRARKSSTDSAVHGRRGGRLKRRGNGHRVIKQLSISPRAQGDF